LIKRLISGPGAYVIPRTDGSLLIGETVEDAGFDVEVDPAAIEGLRTAAVRAVPALDDLSISQTWAGLRPRSPNGRPFVGQTSLEGYYVAAGHYRHAVLLAPTTAMAVANVIEGNGA
jgi:glycine oxidase